MKTIEVSLDVYARIWALRQSGEDSENAVLHRVLFQDSKKESSPAGLRDSRHDVVFDEGFKIFRTYRGQYFSAEVRNGQWKLAGLPDDFASLNDLSKAIGAKTENAWENWFYLAPSGKSPVSKLRDPSRIARRKNPDVKSNYGADMTDQGRWVDDIVEALRELGGRAPLSRIYEAVSRIRKAKGRSLPATVEATIRRTLENHSSDSDNFLGTMDLFSMPEGKGAGIWALLD